MIPSGESWIGLQRERRLFHWALLISLLLHVVIVLLVLPGMHELWARAGDAKPLFALVPEQPEQPPLEFEFVDLAEDREERPKRADAPMSDLDRRAHGGAGDAAERPAVQGTTPQLVQADGGTTLGRGAPPQPRGPPVERVPPPQPAQEPRATSPSEESPREAAEEGAGEPDRRPATESRPPVIQLPRTGAFALPPAAGGLTEAPDRDDGGQVDTGGLSFDTQWYDWGPYARAMLAKIRRNWLIPELARLGVTGIVKVRYYIQPDGTVSGLQIMDESGKPPMDFAARDAIARSSPFAPLPKDLGDGHAEGVTITFFYNTKPPERD